MTYRGKVRNGVIILDPPVSLPEGASVEISPVVDAADASWDEVFKDVAGKAEGLPNDMARNHDHYLHGAPKK